jgi:hypothetical protein
MLAVVVLLQEGEFLVMLIYRLYDLQVQDVPGQG